MHICKRKCVAYNRELQNLMEYGIEVLHRVTAYVLLINSSNRVLNALCSLLTGCMQRLFTTYGVLPRHSSILDIKIAVWSSFTPMVL